MSLHLRERRTIKKTELWNYSPFILLKLWFHARGNVKRKRTARACGAIGWISDSGSEGMGFDPHSVESKVRLFIFSVHLNRQDCSGDSELLGPSPVSWDGYSIPICRITIGGCRLNSNCHCRRRTGLWLLSDWSLTWWMFKLFVFLRTEWFLETCDMQNKTTIWNRTLLSFLSMLCMYIEDLL
jgi:hypothetical protein